MANISIIIPTHNTPDFFYETLQSIANQSYTDYEILIVLNGCNEPYKSKIKKWLRILNLDIKTNLIQTNISGVSNARNIGIEKATGEYVTFIDDDDLISKDYLSYLIKKANPNVEVISNIIKFKNNNINDIVCDSTSEAFIKCQKLNHASIFQIRRLLNSVWARLIPRERILKCRFDKNLTYAEDAIFNFELSRFIPNYVLANEEAKYYYRENPKSVSNKKESTFFWCKQSLKGIKSLLRIYFKSPFSYNLKYFISRIAALLYFGIRH